MRPCGSFGARNASTKSGISRPRDALPHAFRWSDEGSLSCTREDLSRLDRVGSFRELAPVSRARSTLAAKQMMSDLVQISHLHRRSTPFPRSASRLPSGTAPRCLVPASTTDVTSRAPGKTSPPETRRTFRRPACSTCDPARHGLSPRSNETSDHLAVIRPLTGYHA